MAEVDRKRSTRKSNGPSGRRWMDWEIRNNAKGETMRGVTAILFGFGCVVGGFAGTAHAESNPSKTEAEIQRLIKELDDDTFEVRDQAQEKLEQAGEPARPALEKALQSQSRELAERSQAVLSVLDRQKRLSRWTAFLTPSLKEEIRKTNPAALDLFLSRFADWESLSPQQTDECLQVLVGVRSKEIVSLWAELLKDSRSSIRVSALNALAALVRDAEWIPRFAAFLKDEAPDARDAALSALSSMGSEDAWKQVAGALENDVPAIRIRALQLLGNRKEASWIPAIAGLLKDPDAGTRAAAVAALSSVGSEEAAKRILPALDDEDDGVRQRAARTLWGRDGGALLLDRAEALCKSENPLLQQIGLQALVKRDGARSQDAVRQALASDSEETKAVAIYAASECHLREVIPDLMKRVRDTKESARVRCAAIHALELLGAKEAEDALITCLSSEDVNVRLQAVSALAKVGSPKAVPAIAALLKSELTFENDAAAIYETQNKTAVANRDLMGKVALAQRLRPKPGANPVQGKFAFRGDPGRAPEVMEAAEALGPINAWQPCYVYVHRMCVETLEAITGKRMEGTDWREKRTAWLKAEASK